MLIYNLYITLTFILRKKIRKEKRERWKEEKKKGGRKGRRTNEQRCPKCFSCDMKTHPTLILSIRLPCECVFPFVFPLSSLGTFGFCSQSWFLYHPGCFRPSSFHVLLPCLPLYSFAFTCFQLHITHTKGRKSHSKANEILQLNILYNVTNHVI